MSKIRNEGITDKWGFLPHLLHCHSSQNLKDRNSSLWTCMFTSYGTVNWGDFGPRGDFGPNEKKVIL